MPEINKENFQENEEEDDELCQSTLTPHKYECIMQQPTGEFGKQPHSQSQVETRRSEKSILNISKNRYSQVSLSSNSKESSQNMNHDLEVSSVV